MEWVYSGVNQTVPRNAGPDCAAYMSPQRRWIETVIAFIASLLLLRWGYQRISLSPVTHPKLDATGSGRRTLLVVMSVIWGMEIGYKFSSRTVIYLLNPCHVTTAIQIFLLAANPSKMVTAVFRIHLNLLNGPLLAYLFPETDTRILPLESAIYWIQHGLMFVVPYYLFRIEGPYNVEMLTDFSWNAVSYSLNMMYHFLILQALAIPTEVNLNHMLCPAILDPFEGPNYRIFGVLHQAILCPLLCKLFCIISSLLNNFLVTMKKKRSFLTVVLKPNINGNVLESSIGNSQHLD